MPRFAHRPLRALVAPLALAALLSPVPAGPATSSAAPGAAPPAPDTPSERQVDRVVDLCRVWTTVKFLHPFLLTGATDWNGAWDRAFVEAAPAVLAASSTEEHRRALVGMVAVLDDPATTIEPALEETVPAADGAGGDAMTGATTGAGTAEPQEPPPLFRHLSGDGTDEGAADDEGLVLLDAAGFQRSAGGYRLLVQLLYGHVEDELAGARALIVDLRIPAADLARDATAEALEAIAEKLVPEEVREPAVRWPVYWGYPTQVGRISGTYQAAFATSLPRVIVPSGLPADGDDRDPADHDPAGPARSDHDRGPRRTVFLVNRRTQLPAVALALRDAGHARFVSEGPQEEARLAERIPVELGEGLVARIRTTEPLPGAVPFGADVVVDPDGAGSGVDDPALRAAKALLAEPWDAPSTESLAEGIREPAPEPATGRWRPEHRYPEMTAPTAPWRLLAGCRMWGTIDTFYPYLDLIGDWDGAFRRAIPELLAEPPAGHGEEAYARALLHLAAAIEDGHTALRGPAVDRVLGTAPPPITLREVEGRWVVTEVLDPAIEDPRVGDVVETVDGVPMERRLATTWDLVTASTERSHRHRAAVWSLFGAPGSRLRLGVRGADGGLREVTLTRGRSDRRPPPDTDPPYRLVDDQLDDRHDGAIALGYVDLTRLRRPQVDAMFEALGETDGLVLDLRGYPHGTGFALAARLNTRGAKTLAQFRRREVSRMSYGVDDVSHVFSQRMPPPDGPIYRGAVVVLIDGRAISQAEHTALALEAAADPLFVGSPTDGTNGDVTTMVLPGDLELWFTGHDVRHADGRQLQRIGILPDVEAEPTLEGIRAGRDEVLERGIAVLREAIGD